MTMWFLRLALYCFIGCFLVGVLFFLTLVEYAYPLNVNYVLMQSYEEESAANTILYHERASGCQVEHVTEYAVLKEHVVGRSGAHFFIARPDGTIESFEEVSVWLRECRSLDPSFEGQLQKPSRMHSTPIVVSYAVTILLMVIWLAGMLCMVFRGNKGDTLALPGSWVAHAFRRRKTGSPLS